METLWIVLYLVLYLAVAFTAWTRVYSALYRWHVNQFDGLPWSSYDRTFGIVWGGGVSLIWPLSIVAFAVGFVLIRGAIALTQTKPVVNFLKRMEK